MITFKAGDQRVNHRAQLNKVKSRRLFAFIALAATLCGSAVLAQVVTGQRLFVVESVTRAVQSQFAQRGAVNSYLISEGSFDPDNNGRFEHVQLFREMFTSYVPATYTGPVCLNWEGQGISQLINAPITSPEFRDTVKSYASLLKIAKELRPNAQIGFYNLPLREYWNRSPAWRERNLALQPIIDASECVFPSVYDFYRTGQWEGHHPEEDLTYVRENVAMALEMAHGKPVYPYVSPRFHVSNYTYGMQLISTSEFKSHVGAVFEAEFKGDRADGVVWWGADRYYRWLGEQNYAQGHPQFWMSYVCRMVFAAEIPPNTTDDAHFTNIHRRTLRQLSDVINGAF